jgi:hypothetical protein
LLMARELLSEAVVVGHYFRIAVAHVENYNVHVCDF